VGHGTKNRVALIAARSDDGATFLCPRRGDEFPSENNSLSAPSRSGEPKRAATLKTMLFAHEKQCISILMFVTRYAIDTEKTGPGRPEKRRRNGMPRGWHKEDIKAAIRKTGTTLEGLSIANGLQPKACAQALHRPAIVAELVIADYLGFSPRQIWPQRFEPDGRRRDGRRHRKG
jgi:Ner family transcriptional regulator